MNVLSIVVPIFGLILAGWFLRRLRLLNNWMVDTINNYVYYVGISVITFISLHDTSTSVLLDPEIYVLTVLPMLIVICIAYAAAKLLKLKRDLFAVFIICAFFGNTAYIGFPVNIMVQGQSSLNLTAFISTIYTIVVFTVGVFLLKSCSDEPIEAGKIHKLPILWAALLGVLLSWLVIPGVVRLPLEWISDSVSPLALLATGAMVEGASLKSDIKSIGVLSFIKLIIMPATVIVTGLLTGSTGTIFKTSLLEAATPVGVTNSVLAAQFRMRKDFASQAVIITTILFAATLAVLLFII